MLCYVLKFCLLTKNERFDSNHMFQLDQRNAENTCCSRTWSPLEHTGKAFTNAPLSVAGYIQNEYRIIDGSKQCHFCLWIYLSLHFMKMQTNCFQEHPEAICVTRCVVNTIFHRCFLKIYVHCSDEEVLDSLRLFTCQLSPAVNENIYFRI